MNTFLNFGVILGTVLIRDIILFNTSKLLTYLIYYETLQAHLAVLAIINLFCNFQQFIVIALKELKSELENSFLSEKLLKNILENLLRIENFIEAFEKTFGFQMTLVTINGIFLLVTFVSI